MELNLADGVGDGLLGFVRVFGASVNLEFRVLSLAEASLGKHAVDCALNQKNGAAFANHAWSFNLLSADITREAGVNFGIFLSTGEHNLIGVDHNHEIASVNMSGVIRSHAGGKQNSGAKQKVLGFGFEDNVEPRRQCQDA